MLRFLESILRNFKVKFIIDNLNKIQLTKLIRNYFELRYVILFDKSN